MKRLAAKGGWQIQTKILVTLKNWRQAGASKLAHGGGFCRILTLLSVPRRRNIRGKGVAGAGFEPAAFRL